MKKKIKIYHKCSMCQFFQPEDDFGGWCCFYKKFTNFALNDWPKPDWCVTKEIEIEVIDETR